MLRITADKMAELYRKHNVTPSRGVLSREDGTRCCGLGVLALEYNIDISDTIRSMKTVLDTLSDAHGYNQTYLQGFWRGFDSYRESELDFDKNRTEPDVVMAGYKDGLACGNRMCGAR